MLRPRTTVFLALAVALTACGPGIPDGPPVSLEAYQTRGLVRQLPSADRPDSRSAGSELYVHHEAIPDFRNAGGQVVGMESMAMPFPVADPALLAGLAAGDKIAFTFEVRWEGGNPLRITRLEKLPPETRLAFEPSSDPPPDENDATVESEPPAK